MQGHSPQRARNVEDILEVDRWARERATLPGSTMTRRDNMENLLYSIIAVWSAWRAHRISRVRTFSFRETFRSRSFDVFNGFGPGLWVKKKGGTEYALSAFPLGGYVKMVGEDPEEEVKAVDLERSFAHKSLLKRTATAAAGPGFNLLLAVFLLMLVFLFMVYRSYLICLEPLNRNHQQHKP